MFSFPYIHEPFVRPDNSPQPTSRIESTLNRPINPLNKELALLVVERYLSQEFTTIDHNTIDEVINFYNSNYNDATQLLLEDSNRAARIAAYEFLEEILTSDNYITLRENINTSTIADIEVLVASIILKMDFDRSFDNITFIANPDGSINMIPLSEQQYYINNLQILLVQRLFEEGRNQILQNYSDDPVLVVNGNLTNAGRLLSLLTPLSYTGVSRLGQDRIPVLTTPELFARMNEELNQLSLSEIQTIFINRALNITPPYDYLPNYGTIYPGQPGYDYFDSLLNGDTTDIDTRVLFYKRNVDGSIDVFMSGNNLSHIGTDQPTGQINFISHANMIARLESLFPLDDFQRLLIERNQAIYMGRTEQNRIYASVLPILSISPQRIINHIEAYEADPYSNFNQLATDTDFDDSRSIIHLLSLFDYCLVNYNLEESLMNIGDLRNILVRSTTEMYELAGNNHYIPYLRVKFVEWLEQLSVGKLALKNPTQEQLEYFPDSISIIFDGERIFITINSINTNNLAITQTFEINENGFVDTLIVPEGERYMIPLGI